MLKTLINSSKGILLYMGVILLLAIAGLISIIFFGPHNRVESWVENALDSEIEQKLNLPQGSVKIDLDKQVEKSDSK